MQNEILRCKLYHDYTDYMEISLITVWFHRYLSRI